MAKKKKQSQPTLPPTIGSGGFTWTETDAVNKGEVHRDLLELSGVKHTLTKDKKKMIPRKRKHKGRNGE